MKLIEGAGFSSDLLGAIPTMRLEHVLKLYELAGFKDPKTELVMLPWQIYYLEEIANGKSNIPIVGLHGKLGVSADPAQHHLGIKDWFVAKPADILFSSLNGSRYNKLPALIDAVGEKQKSKIYFNVHNDEIAAHYSTYINWARKTRSGVLSIENGTNPGDIWRVINLVTGMRSNGVKNVHGLLDLVHAVKEMSGGKIDMGAVKGSWGKVLSILEKYPDIFRRIHIPIGVIPDGIHSTQDRIDALPIMEMIAEGHMLRDLARVIKQQHLDITFENQPRNMVLGQNYWSQATSRVMVIREGLENNGFAE